MANDALKTAIMVLGVLLAAGISFAVMTRMFPFEWMLARRYLALLKARSPKIHLLTMVLATVWLGFWALSYYLDHAHSLKVEEIRENWGHRVDLVRDVAIVLTISVEVFLRFVRRFTIFSTISTYGLFLGTAALVIVLSVMSGFETDLKHKILGINAHVTITRPDQPFTDYEEVRGKVLHLGGVIGVTPYISSEVMLSSQSNLAGVVLKGIDPDTDGTVTDLEKDVDLGELKLLNQPAKLLTLGGPPIFRHDDDELAPSPSPGAMHFQAADSHGKAQPLPELPSETRRVIPGVVLGRELAKNMRLYLGDDVNVVCPLCGMGPQGPIPRSKPFRTAGIFFSGMFEYDSKYIYMTIPAAQKFLGMEDEVTGLELKVADSDRTDVVVAEIQKALGPGYDVQDWQELNRSLFSALKLEKIAMFIVLCFIVLVAAFSIIANGIMLVMEKGQEIAILKSMGATDRSLMIAFMFLGAAIGGLGTGVGILTGVAACLALATWGLPLDADVYYITKLPVRMNPHEVVLVAVAALVIGMLATLYPAWTAARLRPVEGLRENNR